MQLGRPPAELTPRQMPKGLFGLHGWMRSMNWWDRIQPSKIVAYTLSEVCAGAPLFQAVDEDVSHRPPANGRREGRGIIQQRLQLTPCPTQRVACPALRHGAPVHESADRTDELIG
ncbi:MAG TPA: hypothetical protein VJ802_07640 [Gemmatimonadaceae bacterium]|nr:hypothetical protein [Gemmatimonadaceae bacterium]